MTEQLYHEKMAPSPELVAPESCPLREVLDRVGDKWSVLIVMDLREGSQRFNSLKRRIEGISQRMLSETLRQLERDGLVCRTVYAEQPVRVDYQLAALGRTLIEPIAALAAWSEQNRAKITAARLSYDRTHAQLNLD